MTNGKCFPIKGEEESNDSLAGSRFLEPGDEVTIEIEGIGTLTTPMRSASGMNKNRRER